MVKRLDSLLMSVDHCEDRFVLSVGIVAWQRRFLLPEPKPQLFVHSFFCTQENNLVQMGIWVVLFLVHQKVAWPGHHQVWPELTHKSHMAWLQAETISLSFCVSALSVFLFFCLSISNTLPLLKKFIVLYFHKRSEDGSACFVNGENDTDNSHLGWGEHKHGEFLLNHMADMNLMLHNWETLSMELKTHGQDEYQKSPPS